MENVFSLEFWGPILSFVGAIIVALISYKGVKETNAKANSDMQNEMKTQQALFNQKLDQLTEEVREHNNFARRMPVVEAEIESLGGRINRLEDKLDSKKG